MTIAHRDADADDRNFIGSAWASSYRGSNTAGFTLAEDWYAHAIMTITKIRAQPDVRTVVAYETSDPDRGADLYGFIVADTTPTERYAAPLVYYVFVKQAYRLMGIARGLFAAVGIDPAGRFDYVCSTPSVTDVERKISLAKWAPLRGRFPKHERRTAR